MTGSRGRSGLVRSDTMAGRAGVYRYRFMQRDRVRVIFWTRLDES